MKCKISMIFMLILSFLVFFADFMLSETIAFFEIFRHGARQPRIMESVSQKLLYSTGAHQLTPNGFKQHLLLGKIYRDIKYKDLFNSTSPTLNFVSSPIERCIFSATGQILGMFPGKTVVYANQNNSLNIKDDDVPPGYEKHFLKTRENKKENRRNRFTEEEDEMGDLLDSVNLRIIDPDSDGYFHPDRCTFITNNNSTDSSSSSNSISDSANSNSSSSNSSNATQSSKRNTNDEFNVDDIQNDSNDSEDSNKNELKTMRFKSQHSKLRTRKRIDLDKQRLQKPRRLMNQAKTLIKHNKNSIEINNHFNIIHTRKYYRLAILLTEKEKPLFDFSKEELENAIDAITSGLTEAFRVKIQASEWQWPFEESNKYTSGTLKKLVKFIVPLRYHFTGKTKDLLMFSDDIEKTMKKSQINAFYAKKLSKTEEVRLLFSDIMSEILGIMDSNDKSINIFSGHDTNIVNFLTNILDVDKIKPKLLTSVEKDNEDEFNFFIPPFASSLLFELYKDNDGVKYVKAIFNNKEIVDDWVTGIDYTKDKGVKLDEFIKVFSDLIVDTSKGVWSCNNKDFK